MAKSCASLIVVAAHLRGYLRKLDTAAEAARERAEANRLASLRACVDGAPDALADLERQLAKAEEGEARHQKWLNDQRDAARAHELRQQITAIQSEAKIASEKLAGFAQSAVA